MSGAGKGSRSRTIPTDEYRERMDAIFRKNEPAAHTCDQGQRGPQETRDTGSGQGSARESLDRGEIPPETPGELETQL